MELHLSSLDFPSHRHHQALNLSLRSPDEKDRVAEMVSVRLDGGTSDYHISV